VSDAAFVTTHSVRLTGLTPSTAYYFRVRSTDRSGNEAAKPSLPPPTVAGQPAPPPGPTPPTFTMPNPMLHDTMAADFAAGTSTGTYIAETVDGEVILAPARGAEFSGSTMPSGWATGILSAGGSAEVANGKLIVNGARVATCVTVGVDCDDASQFTLVPGTAGISMEFVATFTGDPYQHAGLGQTLTSSGEPFALFSTVYFDDTDPLVTKKTEGGILSVRTYNGTGNETGTNLGTELLNLEHRFRIDWLPTEVVYFVDTVEVARHAVVVAGPLRTVAASDYDGNYSGKVVVDWSRMLPYARAGTFISRVVGASALINWQNIQWTANAPAGTGVVISVRTGNTQTPDGTWSAFAPIAAQGPLVGQQSQYIQYLAEMTTNDPNVTPALSDVRISGVALPPSPPQPSDQTITFAALGGKTFGDSPFFVNASSSSGLPVTFSIASGPASVAGNLVTITGAGTVVVRASAAGGDSAGIQYRPADDVDRSFGVAKKSQTIIFGALINRTLSPAAFAVSATASSGLPVSFSISGPATIGPGNMVTMTGAGLVKVLASQLGSGDVAAAPPVEQSFTVMKNNSSVVVTSNNAPALDGVTITLTATVSSTVATVATGTVSFIDSANGIVCADSVLSASVATCTTSKLTVGPHAITAVYAGDASLAASTSAAFSQVIEKSATLVVKFSVFALQDGTSKPKVATLPAPNAVVKVFSTANACVGNLFKALHPKKWGEIFDGADGVGGVAGCPAVSHGSYQATGTTDPNGNVTIIVPPLAISLGNEYLVIGRATNFDYVKTAVSPDPLYSSYPVLAAPAGTTRSVPLSLVATFNGKIVPGKRLEEYGSYLAIIEPEFMDWTAPVEQYPFVLVAEGDWGIETSVTPPDGFVADQPVLSTEVVNNVAALQFTLTDIGSDWTETGITHVIKHKGEIRIRTSAVPMFNKQPNAAKGDNAAKKDTNDVPREVTRPVLPSRIIAKLMGMLF
jgi:hypothetical protein